jgi:hypothetical protein
MHLKANFLQNLSVYIINCQNLRTLSILSLLVFCIACNKETKVSYLTKCSVPTQFPQLNATITEAEYTHPLTQLSVVKRDTTYYFYNISGQIDSIQNQYGSRMDRKINYLPDGRVQSLFTYNNGQIQVSTYTYTGNTVTVTSNSHSVTYQLDQNGALTTATYQNGNDREEFTLDSCNQNIRIQRFYLANNQEHYLEEIVYSDVYDPFYLAGFHRVFPRYNNLHLTAWTEIVHWDCADYMSGKIQYEHTVNADGFVSMRYLPQLNMKTFYLYQ